ncbi:MAG TPA: Crp/Fnr family transcriptional regulator [Solirubrobacteraceae bacterium]|nr:Crp/Fnr family transcriptional regulator [Solirubrobacteraceae bacterium]
MTRSALRSSETVRVLDIDPDLAGPLRGEQLEAARKCSQAVVLEVIGPQWDPAPIRETATPGWLGLYLIRGVMLRMVHVGQRTACELFGPGDVIRPWDADGEYEPLAISMAWRVARPAQLAVMDTRFAQCVGGWPTIVSALMQRVATRGRSLALSQAVNQFPRADARLLVTFWLLSERWGTVGPAGITVNLPLTHEVLAMIIGVQRPTVTLALHRLADAELLTRPRQDRWLLTRAAVDYLHDPESLRLLGGALSPEGPVPAG